MESQCITISIIYIILIFFRIQSYIFTRNRIFFTKNICLISRSIIKYFFLSFSPAFLVGS